MLPLELRQETAKLEPIFISGDGEAYKISEVKPSSNFAISTTGDEEKLPIDIEGKTLN